MKNTIILRILVFYAIAIVVSNFFRFNLFRVYENLNTLGTWNKLYFAPLQSVGVLIGGLLGMYLLGRTRETTHSLFGNDAKWSLLIGCVPITFFSVVGVQNTHGTNPHALGFVFGTAMLTYAVFEEFGWRGYLQEELKDRPEWLRVLVIAIAWYVWHLNFIKNPDPVANTKFFGIMLLGSWGIGKIMDSTKSILVAGCFHTLYNVFTINEQDILLSSNTKWFYIGSCVVVWIVTIKLWERNRKKRIEPQTRLAR